MDDSKTGVFAMSGLHALRSRLGRLRYRRALMRWQTALARGLVLDIIALFALALTDFTLRLDTVPRAIAMLVTVALLAWRMLRHIAPVVSTTETISDIALMLERSHDVDSDLVAALQFDAAENENVGSLELQRAVVDRATNLSETLDFRSAVPKDDARRASSHAAIAVLSVAVCWIAFPSHASAFWNRLCLGNAKYPTRTRIDEVTVNGQTDAARLVEGELAAFHVRCSGVTPNEGVAELRGIETGDSTSVLLKRVDESSDIAVYAAESPPINERMEYSIRIGDAETESRIIALIQRPIVELTIEATAPAYMRRETTIQHEHYVEANEGSSIELSIRCTNGKRLAEARFELIKGDEQAEELEAIAFAPTDESRLNWRLDADASGLTRVAKDFQYRVAIIDEDGLTTFHPIEGVIRVKPDRAPVATISSLHHAIMPNARPTVTFSAEDDFGIGTMTLYVRRASTRQPKNASLEPQDEKEHVDSPSEFEDRTTFEVTVPEPSGAERIATHRADQLLELSSLKLAKGDKVLVWLRVTDYRGEWPGISTLSEAIELEVTDERGVLDAILRSDADAEQILTDVIEKELGLRSDR